MRFIHVADVHLGADPYIGSAEQGKRKKELWNSLERVLAVCENEQVELLLIAGDLFHRQPLRRELKELNYLFGRMTKTKVVMIAGNHDYLKKDSYYRTFSWSQNVSMILDTRLACVEIPEYQLAVYGFSYDEKEIPQERLKHAVSKRRQKYEILLAHGGDDRHVPMKREDLLGLGYDYIALGHIHKPGIVCPDKVAYAGALEPIDKNDTGVHGYIEGELSDRGSRIRFVPFAEREYIHLEVPVHGKMTGAELRETVKQQICEYGNKNIYKITIIGERDPEIMYDLEQMDPFGNVIEVLDETRPAYQFERLKAANRENILGMLIEEWEASEPESVEYQAMCEGVRALMETRRSE